MTSDHSFINSFIAGGMASLTSSFLLFPLDTIKTRIQSENGLFCSGGFKNVYKGFGQTVTFAIPISAIFFTTYDSLKHYIGQYSFSYNHTYNLNAISAVLGEGLCCTLRVPVEIAKQYRQIQMSRSNNNKITKIKYENAIKVFSNALKNKNIRSHVFRVYIAMLSRDIPYSFILFPLWEYSKLKMIKNRKGLSTADVLVLQPISVAFCGAISSGIAAGLTTPFDVAKTRIVLNGTNVIDNPKRVILDIYKKHGLAGLYAGFLPRIMFITVGGAFYLGFYDWTINFLQYLNIF